MVEKIIENIKHLPPIPNVINELQDLYYFDDYNASDIEKIIKKDPNLVANILKIANSPYYGLPREFIDIRQAIVYFGLDKLVEFAFATVLDEVLKFDLDFYGIDKGIFMKMSQQKAKIAKIYKLPKKDKLLVSNTAFLSDISKVILSQYAISEGRSLPDGDWVLNELDNIEKELLGVDTIEVSIQIFDYWNFDEKMIELLENFKKEQNDMERALFAARDITTLKANMENLSKYPDIEELLEKISK